MIRWKTFLAATFGTICLTSLLYCQTPQVVAVRAGRLFDSKSGELLLKQVVLLQGDRITDVGPEDQIKIPAGAQVLDLQATPAWWLPVGVSTPPAASTVRLPRQQHHGPLVDLVDHRRFELRPQGLRIPRSAVEASGLWSRLVSIQLFALIGRVPWPLDGGTEW